MKQEEHHLSTSLMDYLSTNNELSVGKFPLKQIENLVSSTPFYAYDRQLIINRVTQLTQILPKKISIHYAIKAKYPKRDMTIEVSEDLENGSHKEYQFKDTRIFKENL